jgi:GH25 family lysozyme M1 (1,4-beta-N-acetylmuramidase)
MIIDISSNQGRINWKLVPTNEPKVDGIYIKASEGVGYTDPQLRINALEASQAGIPIGYYHFCSLNNSIDVVGDAKQEAQYFFTATHGLPVPHLPYVLDVETNKSHLIKDQTLLWIRTFFNELEKKDIKDYVLYSYTPFLNENLPTNHGLGNVRLWLASYTPTYKLPYGWNSVWLWQYSNQGQIAGIKTRVDLNKKPSL